MGVASGRPCLWALMLRDKATGKRKLLSRNQSKRGAVLPQEESGWERQAPGSPDWGNRTGECGEWANVEESLEP